MQNPEDLHALRQLAEEQGLNLCGLVSAEEFDSCQPVGRRLAERLPGCGSVLVFGSGGGVFWNKLQQRNPVQDPRPGYHPIHAASTRCGELVQSRLRSAGHECVVTYPEGEKGAPALNFLQMAEMAGLGTISPVIGLLLHPEFGPWVSLRLAVLLRGEPFSADALPGSAQVPAPCLTCETKPCLAGCPAQVFDGSGGVDLCGCAASRVQGVCASHCDMRRACPVGAEHRYSESEESFRHAYSTFTMRRHFGYGIWKFVPRRLR